MRLPSQYSATQLLNKRIIYGILPLNNNMNTKIKPKSYYRLFVTIVTGCGIAWSISYTATAQTEVKPRLIAQNTLSWEEMRNEADLQLRLGSQAESKGQLEKAIAHWQNALNLYQKVDNNQGMGVTYDYLSLVYLRLGMYREAEDALRRRLAFARDAKDFQGQIYGLNNLGTALLQAGRLDGAEMSFNEALVIARDVANIAGQGLSLSNLGLVAANRGDYYEAIKRYESALNYRRKAQDVIGQANTYNNLGDAYLAVKDPTNALYGYRLADSVASDTLDYNNHYRALKGSVASYNLLGRYTQAFAKLNEWAALARKNGDLAQELDATATAADLYRIVGDKQQAEKFYQDAIALAVTIGDQEQQALLRQRLSLATFDNY